MEGIGQAQYPFKCARSKGCLLPFRWSGVLILTPCHLTKLYFMRFLTTSGLVHEIDRTIVTARDLLLLVTPYVKFSQNFYERLQDATERGAEVALVCRFESLKGQALDDLLELRGVRVFDHKGLHAKCFANEAQIVIGSMNLYQASEGNR